MKRKVFPFTAVLGQERIKNALIWNFINPRIGGVLVSGEKGTAKSTLIRGAEHISGKKVIELPLNITEDRLIEEFYIMPIKIFYMLMKLTY